MYNPHTTHCCQGEFPDCCKYGDIDCPELLHMQEGFSHNDNDQRLLDDARTLNIIIPRQYEMHFLRKINDQFNDVEYEEIMFKVANDMGFEIN